jgi:HTH DNA binding domain
MIAKELDIIPRAAQNLVAELGLREATGRGRYRVGRLVRAWHPSSFGSMIAPTLVDAATPRRPYARDTKLGAQNDRWICPMQISPVSITTGTVDGIAV